MSWVIKCDMCGVVSDSYFLQDGWIVAEEQYGTFTVAAPRNDSLFAVPKLPGFDSTPRYGLGIGTLYSDTVRERHADTGTYNVRHFCGLDCLQKKIAAIHASVPADGADPAHSASPEATKK